MTSTRKLLIVGLVLAILSLPFKFIGLTAMSKGVFVDTTATADFRGYQFVTGTSVDITTSNLFQSQTVSETPPMNATERVAGLIILASLLLGAVGLTRRERLGATLGAVGSLLGAVAIGYFMVSAGKLATIAGVEFTRSTGFGLYLATLAYIAYIGAAVTAWRNPAATTGKGRVYDFKKAA